MQESSILETLLVKKRESKKYESKLHSNNTFKKPSFEGFFYEHLLTTLVYNRLITIKSIIAVIWKKLTNFITIIKVINLIIKCS